MLPWVPQHVTELIRAVLKEPRDAFQKRLRSMVGVEQPTATDGYWMVVGGWLMARAAAAWAPIGFRLGPGPGQEWHKGLCESERGRQ